METKKSTETINKELRTLKNVNDAECLIYDRDNDPEFWYGLAFGTNGLTNIYHLGRMPGGYKMFAINTDEGVRFYCGCRWFTYDEAVKHWSAGKGHLRADFIADALPKWKMWLEGRGWSFAPPKPKTKKAWCVSYTEISNKRADNGIWMHNNKASSESNRDTAIHMTHYYKNVSPIWEQEVPFDTYLLP